MTPVAYTYPSSLSSATSSDTVNGFMSPYALDPTTHQMDSVLPVVSGTTPTTGQIAITVADILLPGGAGTEPSFVVTFGYTGTAGTPLLNSPTPLDEVGCSGCLKTETAPATRLSDGTSAGSVTFTYLDVTSSSFPLNYSTLGLWTKPSTVVPPSAWTEVGGAFSAGVLSRGVDLPTTGTADYSGYFLGRYVTSDLTPAPGTYLVGANAQAHVDFSGPGVTFSTSNTYIQLEGSTSAPLLERGLDLSTIVPMPITRTSTSNSFSGVNTSGVNTPLTTTTSTIFTATDATGQIGGAFYGPPASTAPYAPPEMGGSLAVRNSTNTQSMVGSFALKH